MSTEATPTGTNRANVGMPIIIAAVIAVIAFVGFLGYQILTPREYPPPIPKNAATPNPSAVAFQNWAKDKYRETGGDWSKLSPPDQQRFNSAGFGQGKSLFQSYNKP